MSGPDPAVEGLATTRTTDGATGAPRTMLVGGEPTWSGQDLAACQRLVDRIGLAAFERECQHRVQERDGARCSTGATWRARRR
ncbi:hypothetical protein tb265_00440 [Gemmatimonadetes bacterium T265]|nr:hypothetical protein tb265_00440 [Gemmatimonadetes bacterium T265]